MKRALPIVLAAIICLLLVGYAGLHKPEPSIPNSSINSSEPSGSAESNSSTETSSSAESSTPTTSSEPVDNTSSENSSEEPTTSSKPVDNNSSNNSSEASNTSSGPEDNTSSEGSSEAPTTSSRPSDNTSSNSSSQTSSEAPTTSSIPSESSNSRPESWLDISGLTYTQADVGKVVGYTSVFGEDITVVSVEEGTTADGRKFIEVNFSFHTSSHGSSVVKIECEYCHEFPCPNGGDEDCPEYDPLKDGSVTCQQCGRPYGDGYNGTCHSKIDWEHGGFTFCNHLDDLSERIGVYEQEKVEIGGGYYNRLKVYTLEKSDEQQELFVQAFENAFGYTPIHINCMSIGKHLIGNSDTPQEVFCYFRYYEETEP